MFFNRIEEAIREASEVGENQVAAFRLARAEAVAKMANFSGIGNAGAARAIGVTPPYIQRVFTEPLSLSKYQEQLTDFLGLPRNTIASPDELTEFVEQNVVYAATIDALMTFRPEAGQGLQEMPSEFAARRCEEYFGNNEQRRNRFLAYLQAPSENDEPDEDDIKRLEKALRLPPGAISSPDEVITKQSSAKVMSQVTRQIVAAKLASIMARRGMENVDVARQCGLPEAAVRSLLGERHVASLSVICALATGLAVDPCFLIDPMREECDARREQTKGAFFAGLPRVARELIIRYAKIVKDKGGDDLPSTKSQAVLLATPVVHFALEYLAGSANWSQDEPVDLYSMLRNIEALLRAGKGPLIEADDTGEDD